MKQSGERRTLAGAAACTQCLGPEPLAAQRRAPSNPLT